VSGTVDALSLPPERAIAFFRQKVNMPTRAWDDLRHGAHARAWSVAGVQAQDMLTDIRAAMDKAIAQGTTLEEFRRDINPLLGRLGWADRGPGYVAWRTRVVYETNMRTAYAAGRYAEMTDPDVLAVRPFWRYRHSGKKDFRREHKDWDGKVIPASDDFWKTHFPPNGWGCGCYVQSLGARDLARLGMDGPDKAPSSGGRLWTDPRTNEKHVVPAGIDPGWDYSVGRSWLDGVAPEELQKPFPRLPGAAPAPELPPLPPPRPVAAEVLPAGLPDEDYVRAFLRPFDADLDRPAVFRDVQGTRVVVSKDFFADGAGGLTKIRKRGRGRYAALLAQAIIAPDEIWAAWGQDAAGNAVIYRSYLRRVLLPDGQEIYALMEFGGRGWLGVTGFPSDRPGYLDRQRYGWLLYRRPADEEEPR
jgi:hypothetical protein